MPDLRPIKQFERDMQSLETRYAAALAKVRRVARLAMVDELSRGKLDNKRILKHTAELKREVDKVAKDHLNPIRSNAEKLALSQFMLVERALSIRTNFDKAMRDTADDRQQPQRNFEQSAAQPIDLLAIQLTTELNRMEATGEEPEAINDRLFSPDLADGRVSVWRNNDNVHNQESQRGLWLTALAVAGILYLAGQEQTGREWQRQAIAAIDERTTDCCLRVHGQVVGQRERFTLTGTPRYADQLIQPPFHWYCRTSVAPYLPEFENIGITTGEMREAARAEIQAREETGTTVEIHPAFSVSGRGF